MSNKRLTAVWEHSTQKGTKLLALLSLADRADNDGYCWPSHKDTAQRARSKRTYVLSILPEIEKAGELYIHRDKREGKTYQYLVIVGMTADEIKAAMKKRFKYSAEDINNKVSVLLTRQQSRQPNDKGVSVQQTPGVSTADTNPKEPSQKKAIEPSRGKKRKPAPKAPNVKHEIFKALIDVTLLKPVNGKTTGRLNAAAKALEKDKRTAEDVRRLYGTSGAWYVHDWRGQRGEAPTPEAVVEEINKLTTPEYLARKQNGSRPAPANAFLDALNAQGTEQ